MKKILLFLFLLIFGLSNAYAIPIGLEDFSDNATVIDFNSIAPNEKITTQFDSDGVTFSGEFYGDFNFPSSTINGSMSGANFDENLKPVTPVVADFGKSMPNKVGMYFGTQKDVTSTSQIQVFRGTTLLETQTFVSTPSDIMPPGDLPTVFGGIFFPGGFNRIELRSSNILDNNAFQVDDFRFETSGNPIPEPATFLLLGAGLVGLAGFGRKKFFRK